MAMMSDKKKRAQTLIGLGIVTILVGLVPMHWFSGSLGALAGLFLIAKGAREYREYESWRRAYYDERGRLLAKYHHEEGVRRMKEYAGRPENHQANGAPVNKTTFTPEELRQYFGPDAEMRVGSISLGTVEELEKNGG